MNSTRQKAVCRFLALALCPMLVLSGCGESPEGPDQDSGQELVLEAEFKSVGVHLSWNRLDRSICSDYLVQRSGAPGGEFEDIDTVDAFIFACVDDNLAANATYCYRLTVLDDGGQATFHSNVDTVPITGSTLCLSDTVCLIAASGGVGNPVAVFNACNPAIFTWSASEDVAWMALTAASGQTPGEFAVDADENSSDVSRFGQVIISAEDILNSPETLVVAQPTTGGILCPSPGEALSPPLGGTNSDVMVLSCAGIPSCGWVAESHADWLTVQNPSGVSPTNLLVTAQTNYPGILRTGIVTVTPAGYEEPPDTVVFTQNPPFDPPVGYAGAGTPSSVCCADLDGDGDVDLAAAFSDQPFLSVLKNNGDGTFAAAVNFSTGVNSKWIRAADLDKDGDRDLVTVASDGQSLAIHRNAGDATFTLTSIAMPENFARVSFGDCDADGDIDIVTANKVSAQALVVVNNGDGTFTQVVRKAVGAGPESVCATNINSVGNVDLVSANSTADNISMLINSTALTYMTAVNFAVQDNPVSLVAGDFNNDTRPDVAVVCQGVDLVSILRNTGRTGNARFESGGNVTVVDQPNSICASDLDADGDIDLAVAGYGLSVTVNGGGGVYAAALNVGDPGEYLIDLCADDFDGDGDRDLAVANTSTGLLTIYINTTF